MTGAVFGAASPAPVAGRSRDVGEKKGERLDRELMELLQELRVLIPGVQVLFAFLLTVPFTRVFGHLGDTERVVYFGAFVATAVSAVLLVAPSVRHRARFRERDKEALVETGNRLALGGTAFLGIAITLVFVLVAERLYGWGWGVVGGIGVALLELWFWYGWSAYRELHDDREDVQTSA
jgi:hypothetical protein